MMQDSALNSWPKVWSDRLKEIQRSTRLTPTAALTLFTFAVISMGGFMFSQSLGIDDEMALFSKENSWVRALQGRFLMGLIDQLVPQSVTALFPYLLLAVSYLLAYTIILSIHGLSHNWKTHIGFLVFILFPTNWLSQEFSINVPGFALGLLATCAAAFISSKVHHEGKSRSWGLFSPLAIALMLIAVSSFQSLITLYLAIGTGRLLFRREPGSSEAKINNNTNIRTLFSTALPWFANAAAALVLNSLSLFLLLRLTHSSAHQVGTYFRSPYFMLRTQPATYLLGNISQLLETYLRPGVFYGHSLWAFTALLVGSIILYVTAAARDKTQQCVFRNVGFSPPLQGFSLMLCLLGLLMFPLALNAVSTPYRIPMRALVALPYVAWLATTIWLELTTALKKPWLHAFGVALSALLVTQCLVVTSSYYAARAFNFRSDQLVASTLISAVIQAQDSSQEQVSRLVSQGALKRSQPYATGGYSTAAGSFFNWDNGSSIRMVAWLRAMGISEIKAVALEQRQDLLPHFATMKQWPSPGSIKVVDGTALVKFSDPLSKSSKHHGETKVVRTNKK
jgi:hypothetical protein